MVEEVEYPGVPFRGGKAVNQVFDPQQLVYSFEGAGKASDYKRRSSSANASMRYSR